MRRSRWRQGYAWLLAMVVAAVGFVSGCASSESSALEDDINQAQVYIDGPIGKLPKNAAKAEKLLAKYFKDDLAVDDEKIGKDTSELLRRRLVEVYATSLLGKVNVSFLSFGVELVQNAAGETKEGEPGLMAQFSNFIPGELKTKEQVAANLPTLNNLSTVVDRNYGIEQCMRLAGRKANECCELYGKEAGCEEASKIKIATGDKKQLRKDNQGLSAIATASCFLSIVRSTALSVAAIGKSIDQLDPSDSLASIGFSKALQELDAADTFIRDLGNITTRDCIASGFMGKNDPMTKNMKVIETALTKAVELANGDTTKGVTQFVADQFGITCEDPVNFKNCKQKQPGAQAEADETETSDEETEF